MIKQIPVTLVRAKQLIMLLSYLICNHHLFAQHLSWNVLSYGAKNDGTTINTKAIQQAIDSCAARGGGTVEFPAGKYVSGTLVLKSNIILNFTAGAELLGSTDLADYPPITAHFISYSSTFMDRSLIFAENVEHIGITGHGTINGRGDLFPRGIEKNRPVMIRMVGCTDVTVRDISLDKPAMWTQHYLDCKHVTIDGIRVTAWNANANNDGIDIDGCDGVIISNSFILSDDDAICLKSDAPGLCQNISISNCILSSTSNGLKCGTDSYGGFENIVITNCVITNTMLSGIALEIVDGGYMNNVSISNIVMRDVNNPIFIRLGDRGRLYTAGTQPKPAGTMRNINIANLTATGVGNFTLDPKDKYLYQDKGFRVRNTAIGCPISGIPGHDIEQLSLTNISIAFKGGGTKSDISLMPPEKTKEYPEYFMFGNLPSYAFFIRHVKGLFMQNVVTSVGQQDDRPAICLRDVKNSRISDFSGEGSGGLFLIDSSKQVVIRDCYRPGEESMLATIKNFSTGIEFIRNDLFNEKINISKDETIKKSDVIVK